MIEEVATKALKAVARKMGWKIPPVVTFVAAIVWGVWEVVSHVSVWDWAADKWHKAYPPTLATITTQTSSSPPAIPHQLYGPLIMFLVGVLWLTFVLWYRRGRSSDAGVPIAPDPNNDFLKRQQAEEDFMRSVKNNMPAAELKRRWNEPGFQERVNAMPIIANSRHPRIYVEIVDEREGVYKKTPFIIHNRGEQDAHDIRIEFGEIRRGKIEFERDVPVVFAGKQVKVVPKVEGTGILGMKNVISLLLEEWNSYNDIAKQKLIVPMGASYRDASGNGYESVMEIIFYPYEEIASERPRHQQDAPIIETRFIESRPVKRPA
jgi:hypothetical protein